MQLTPLNSQAINQLPQFHPQITPHGISQHVCEWQRARTLLRIDEADIREDRLEVHAMIEKALVIVHHARVPDDGNLARLRRF